eukprot:scaffold101064_cov30-Attheya_sp.AAC.2
MSSARHYVLEWHFFVISIIRLARIGDDNISLFYLPEVSLVNNQTNWALGMSHRGSNALNNVLALHNAFVYILHALLSQTPRRKPKCGQSVDSTDSTVTNY